MSNPMKIIYQGPSELFDAKLWHNVLIVLAQNLLLVGTPHAVDDPTVRNRLFSTQRLRLLILNPLIVTFSLDSMFGRY